jgi:hypothetical protein
MKKVLMMTMMVLFTVVSSGSLFADAPKSPAEAGRTPKHHKKSPKHHPKTAGPNSHPHGTLPNKKN